MPVTLTDASGMARGIKGTLKFSLFVAPVLFSPGEWVWLKIEELKQTAGFGPCFHLQGKPFWNSGFLSHSHMPVNPHFLKNGIGGGGISTPGDRIPFLVTHFPYGEDWRNGIGDPPTPLPLKVGGICR